jgi:hypothetical protein
LHGVGSGSTRIGRVEGVLMLRRRVDKLDDRWL